MSAPALPISDVRRRLPEVATTHAPAVSIGSLMRGVASLRLTVALFAGGIFVVYIGTTAQQEADIWQVVRDYFHAWVMWVDVNLLFPRQFFPFLPHLRLPRF